MIQQFFGLTSIPFVQQLEASQLFASRQFLELKKSLDMLARICGIGLVAGDCGVGKSAAVRFWCSSLNPNSHRILYIHNSTLTPRAFLRTLCRVLNISIPFLNDNLIAEINCQLDNLYYNEKKLPIIVIDEAQNLSPKLLEELRLLSTSQFDTKRKLLIVLISNRTFVATLKQNSFTSLRHRILKTYLLTGIARDELKSYITHQLKLSGCSENIFSDEAVAQIFNYSAGIPRIINSLCLDALESAVQAKSSTVDETLIIRLIEERENF